MDRPGTGYSGKIMHSDYYFTGSRGYQWLTYSTCDIDIKHKYNRIVSMEGVRVGNRGRIRDGVLCLPAPSMCVLRDKRVCRKPHCST